MPRGQPAADGGNMKVLYIAMLFELLALLSCANGQDVSDQSDQLNIRAVMAVENKEFSAAIKLLELALTQDPNNPKTYCNLGTAYFLSHELEKARSALEKGLALNPKSVVILNQLAVVEMESSIYGEAEGNLLKAISLDSDNAVALYNLGCLYIRMKKLTRAVVYLERAKLLKKGYPEIHFNLAFVYGRHGNFSKAIEEARLTVALNQNDFEARSMLVVLFLLKKDRESALKEFRAIEFSGAAVKPWLSRLIFGNDVVSVADLVHK